MKYHNEPLSTVVKPNGACIFDPNAYRVSVDDEAAGCFITIEDHEGSKISFDTDAWQALREAINNAVCVAERINEEQLHEAE